MNAIAIWMFLWMGLPGQTPLIPAGTALRAKLESRVDTATSNVGDPVTAVIVEAIRAREGTEIVPQGTRLNGRVETVAAATLDSEGRVRLVFREMQFPDGRHASTWITQSFSAPTPHRKLRYVLYMAIGVGAGTVVGGNAARAAGIIGGALVGFVIAGNTGTGNLPDVVLKTGRILRLQLGEDLAL